MASAQIQTASREAEAAFYRAIRSGRLSGIPTAENYAGLFMYMGQHDGRAMFKHIDTRQYLS
jgi:hypothetical protein